MRLAALLALVTVGACAPARTPAFLVPVQPGDYPASVAREPVRRALADGEEELGRWRVRCQANNTRAEVTCRAVNRDGFPRVSVSYVKDQRGRIFGPHVFAGPNDCPGYYEVLRVDQRPPERIYEPDRDSNGPAMRRIVTAMEDGETLRSEGRLWPYCTPVADAFQIGGFAPAHSRLRAMIRAARP